MNSPYPALPLPSLAGGGRIPAGAMKARSFCDLKCRHASWPKEEAVDGSGSCRTFLALYCRKKGRLVPKNAVCADKEEAKK